MASVRIGCAVAETINKDRQSNSRDRKLGADGSSAWLAAGL